MPDNCTRSTLQRRVQRHSERNARSRHDRPHRAVIRSRSPPGEGGPDNFTRSTLQGRTQRHSEPNARSRHDRPHRAGIRSRSPPGEGGPDNFTRSTLRGRVPRPSANAQGRWTRLAGMSLAAGNPYREGSALAAAPVFPKSPTCPQPNRSQQSTCCGRGIALADLALGFIGSEARQTTEDWGKPRHQ